MSDFQKVYIVWQNPRNRMWEPVAKLTYSGGLYKLNYTLGADNKDFPGFPRMNIKSKEYFSDTLFPFFSNRLIPEKRPEFSLMLSWLDMSYEEYSPLELLSVSGGARKTDSFRVVSEPRIGRDSKYRMRFFVSGVRYSSDKARSEILSLRQGDSLSYRFDEGNENDPNAVVIFNERSGEVFGYYPKYLNEDLKRLYYLNEGRVDINVVKVNKKAPEQFRLLCEVESDWPKGFAPFGSKEFKDYASNY